MAECTPNLRASYDAAETTPRSLGRPPTTTALPLSVGSNSSSTETKKASMSTWKIVFTSRLFHAAGKNRGDPNLLGSEVLVYAERAVTRHQAAANREHFRDRKSTRLNSSH